MRRHLLVHSAIVAFLVVSVSAAGCGSGEPAATPSPSNPNAVATAVFPTAKSSSDAMVIGGTLWVDGKSATGEVLALIGGKVCGRGQSGRPQSDPPDPVTRFVIVIQSGAAAPGCGVPGAAITLIVDGRAMHETVQWQPGYRQPVSLTDGIPIAAP